VEVGATLVGLAVVVVVVVAGLSTSLIASVGAVCSAAPHPAEKRRTSPRVTASLRFM
jgi:hypothetical protein